MITDLFVVTSGIDGDTVARAIPPACRREPSPPAVVTMSDGEMVLEFPECHPRVASRHLLPSFSMLTGVPYAVRFEVSARAGGTWSPWVATTTIGPGAFAELPTSAGALACDVDVYTAPAPLERVRLRIRLGVPDVHTLAAAPWMATLSASDLAPPVRDTIAVPAARTAEQRRQRRSCIAERLGSGPLHFSQRVSRRTLWCERQAPVDSFTAWRVQPSQMHFPNVIAPPRAARTCAAPRASEMPR